MNRRSLPVLLVLLGLACAGLFVLLERRGAEQAIEAESLAEPGALPQPAEIALAAAPADERGRAQPFTPHTPAREALGPEQGRVAGWLRPQEDKPFRDATVALLECSGAAPVLLAEARCEPDGGFVLECAHEGPLRLVACARGFLPRVEEVVLAHGREQLFEDLELERGVAIAGTLRANARPLSRFEVVAIDERELPVVKLRSCELVFDGRGFDWHYTIADSGPDGRYSIGGLRPGSYSVRISTCRGPQSSLCSGERAPRRALAPASEVDFSFESSALALRFTSAGAPLEDVEVELGCGSWRSGRRSDAQGLVSFELVPRLDCTLQATKRGFETLRVRVSAPASGGSGSESFELQPKSPAPELRFLVSSPHGEAPADLRVRLFAADGELQTPLRDEALRCTPASRASAVKEFVLPDASPGRYRAVLLPGQPWNNDLDPASYIGTHCAYERMLEVPAAGELRTSLSVDRRPALRLEFRDGPERCLPARCTLRDEAGAEMRIVLVDPAQGVPLVGQQLSTLGPTLVYTALSSGKALVQVDLDGRVLFTGTHEFRPGQISGYGR